MKKTIIIYSSIILSILFVCEQVLMLPYLTKTLIKIPLFFFIPILLNNLIFKRKLSLKMDRSSFKLTLIFSLLVFIIVVSAYFIFNSFIDINLIKEDFSNRMKIGNDIMIYSALYTIFINSLIEEVFFRGFIFQGLLSKKNRFFSYVFSSLLFAIYHIAIFKTWFSLPITSLIMLGLFVGGIIFSYFVEKTNSILSSWAVHIAADIGIVYIGFEYIRLVVL